jgi:hypothetical protein
MLFNLSPLYNARKAPATACASRHPLYQQRIKDSASAIFLSGVSASPPLLPAAVSSFLSSTDLCWLQIHVTEPGPKYAPFFLRVLPLLGTGCLIRRRARVGFLIRGRRAFVGRSSVDSAAVRQRLVDRPGVGLSRLVRALGAWGLRVRQLLRRGHHPEL